MAPEFDGERLERLEVGGFCGRFCWGIFTFPMRSTQSETSQNLIARQPDGYLVLQKSNLKA